MTKIKYNLKNIFFQLTLNLAYIATIIVRFFPPETSHDLTLKSLKIIDSMGFRLRRKNQKNINLSLMGLSFKNKLGVSGGLDKNGDYIKALSNLGFGFVELGTVTPRPQIGNNKPRLFRDSKNLAILNRMGFNNKGVEYLISKVESAGRDYNLAISIGINSDTPQNKAIDDYLFCLEKAYPVADFVTINISSPNTEDLRSLHSPQKLPDFLSSLKEKQHSLANNFGYKPLLVKISPDEDEENLKKIAKTLISIKIDGLIATNTTSNHQSAHGKGGISGKPLFKKSTRVLKLMRSLLGKEFPIIASGGVTDLKTYKEKINSGANLVQIYTGIIYKGPKLIQEILAAEQD